MFLRRKVFSPVVFFTGIILIFNAGCQELLNSRTQATPTASETALLDQYLFGLSAYFTGDFETAKTAFETIGQQTSDPLLKRRSLFGLACTQLMQAGSQDEFVTAMEVWDAWVELAPQHWVAENPLLFAPIVNHKLVVPEAPAAVDQTASAQYPSYSMTWQDLNLKRELEQARSQLEKADQQLTARQDTIEALNHEIFQLKEQIKAIELIDQKMQEKKKAIPATD